MKTLLSIVFAWLIMFYTFLAMVFVMSGARSASFGINEYLFWQAASFATAFLICMWFSSSKEGKHDELDT
jgi:hypothetical protein